MLTNVKDALDEDDGCMMSENPSLSQAAQILMFSGRPIVMAYA